MYTHLRITSRHTKKHRRVHVHNTQTHINQNLYVLGSIGEQAEQASEQHHSMASASVPHLLTSLRDGLQDVRCNVSKLMLVMVLCHSNGKQTQVPGSLGTGLQNDRDKFWGPKLSSANGHPVPIISWAHQSHCNQDSGLLGPGLW